MAEQSGLELVIEAFQSAGSEFESAIRAAVDVGQRVLRGPVGLLLSEGEPPGLVLAGACGLDRSTKRTLRRLADPGGPVARALMADLELALYPLNTARGRWLLVPICRPAGPGVSPRLLGALIVHSSCEQVVDVFSLVSLAKALAPMLNQGLRERLEKDLNDYLLHFGDTGSAEQRSLEAALQAFEGPHAPPDIPNPPDRLPKPSGERGPGGSRFS